MTVLLFGGTFNPFHEGHKQMLISAYETLSPSEIWIMPAGNPPHKKLSDDSTSIQRMDMIRLGVKKLSFSKKIRIEERECHSPKKSYTYETLEALCEDYPDIHFIFLIGEDSLDYFQEWRYPERIAAKAEIAVCGRNHSSYENLCRKCKEKEESFKTKFYPIRMNQVDISSSELRQAIFDGKNQDFIQYLEKEVYSYIMESKLYMNKVLDVSDFKEIQKDLKHRLKSSRYDHTLGVMYTCGNLAMKYGYPMEDAMLAGLLHDCAKYHSNEEFLEIAKKNHIPVSESEKNAPQLLHAKVGAFYAKERYGVTDENILHAISVHTTGCEDMNLLDMILFVADYIEPNRNKQPNLKEIRSVSYLNIEESVILILRDTLEYLRNTNTIIDDTTQKTYDFYCRK